MKRKRKPNWELHELEILVEEVGKNYSNIVSKFSIGFTAKDRERIWEDIADKINSASINGNINITF